MYKQSNWVERQIIQNWERSRRGYEARVRAGMRLDSSRQKTGVGDKVWQRSVHFQPGDSLRRAKACWPPPRCQPVLKQSRRRPMHAPYILLLYLFLKLRLSFLIPFPLWRWPPSSFISLPPVLTSASSLEARGRRANLNFSLSTDLLAKTFFSCVFRSTLPVAFLRGGELIRNAF